MSPASSSLSNPTQSDEQVLLATMQPVSVLDLHPKYHHPKYHHHHHHHHLHNHHHHHEDPDAEGQTASPEHEESEHIDLIYNDGQKTVMYTHDKEIIYESEADRVQVVQYPPPPRTPSPPRQLRLHYPQLQLDQELPRGLVNGTNGQGATTTVLVLSELVAADGQLANAVVANMR